MIRGKDVVWVVWEGRGMKGRLKLYFSVSDDLLVFVGFVGGAHATGCVVSAENGDMGAFAFVIFLKYWNWFSNAGAVAWALPTDNGCLEHEKGV